MWTLISHSKEQQGRKRPFVILASCPVYSDADHAQVSEDAIRSDSPLSPQPPVPVEGSPSTRKDKVLPLVPDADSVHPCTPAFQGKIRPESTYGSTSDLHIRRKQIKRATPFVETEVCRSTRLKTQKGGYKHKTCDDKRCRDCDPIPPSLSTKIIRNLCIDYFKVPLGEATEEKLAKEHIKKAKNDDKESNNEKDKKN